jgi:Rad3-related DNA helicase
MESLDSDKRFVAQVIPTGGGKTARVIFEALMAGGRVVYLTATKGLQDQAIKEFKSIGLTAVKGKSNYKCPIYGDCQKGHASRCPNVASPGTFISDCDYDKAYFKALHGELVITNYTYWIMNNAYGRGLGKFDLLVLDEAHMAEEELAGALQIYLGFYDIHEVLEMACPFIVDEPKEWRAFAIKALPRAEQLYSELKHRVERTFAPKPTWLKDLLHLKNLVRKLTMLSRINHHDWIADVYEDKGFILDPIVPGEYAESWLFLGIPKVLLVSATIRLKTLKILNISNGSDRTDPRRAYDFMEYPSPFPVERCPIYQLECQRVDNKCRTPESLRQWIMRADQIIDRRSDRKGIFHTGSYIRRNIYCDHSEHVENLLTNWKGDITTEVVSQFKMMHPPTTLVSPSVTMGYDFPYADSEYSIIGKIPFPDRSNKIVAARELHDNEYSAYKAFQTLEQMCGRDMRAEDDRSEVFIIDDHGEWFVKRYKHLATKGFLARYQRTGVLPRPAEKL